MSKETDEAWAKGYYLGRINTLVGLQERLRTDEELRTLVGLSELIAVWLEDTRNEQNKVVVTSGKSKHNG